MGVMKRLASTGYRSPIGTGSGSSYRRNAGTQLASTRTGDASSRFRVSMTVEGLPEVMAVLAALGATIERRVIVQAMRQAMRPVLASARANVPVKSGTLQRSLRIVTQRSRRQRNILRVGVVPGRRWFTGEGYYAGFIEFGFSKAPTIRINGQLKSMKNASKEGYVDVPARPFLRPALDSNAGQVVTIFADELRSRTAKHLANLARQKLSSGSPALV